MKRIVESFAPRRGSLVPMPSSGGHDLAIDPGVTTGWALFDEGWFTACGIGCPPFDIALRRVCIELPQNYPQNPVPPQDLITLSFLAGRYAHAAKAEAYGDDIFTIFPHEWKGNLPKDVCEARVRGRLSPGELEVVRAAAEDVPAKQRHNMMDAIGIGLFAFRGIRA